MLVAKRDVVRAISNLIHNAIKYSWNRDSDEKRWVTIRSKIVDKEVWIEFENFGVPITKEEIDHEIIFEIGVRGRLSHDRGRTGTGVGLSDARRIARRHGGDVVISSRPVSPGGREDDYLKNPFITTAILKLPLPPKRGGKQL
ncbi:MAG: sensor histidine kinase [Chloroflexi bacterium]|nr:sensor histidine kinase [Chloroflexota bacterium]